MGLAAVSAGYEVILWGRNPGKVEAVCELGLKATSDLAVALKGADLVILAVPVGVMAQLAEQLKVLLEEGALVTDVGSVKVFPHEVAKGVNIPFVGSHPMAGSEQTGIGAARADLLEGAVCVLTNDQGQPEEVVARLGEFWSHLGCQFTVMTGSAHDRAVARISHLPHAMAVATAAAALRVPSDGNLAAGGFRDTTRVAAGDPTMWAEIMVENREALMGALQDAQKEILEMLDQLEKSDKKGLQEYLAKVKSQKENPTRSYE